MILLLEPNYESPWLRHSKFNSVPFKQYFKFSSWRRHQNLNPLFIFCYYLSQNVHFQLWLKGLKIVKESSRREKALQKRGGDTNFIQQIWHELFSPFFLQGLKKASVISKTMKLSKRVAVIGSRVGEKCLSYSDLSCRKEGRKRHLDEVNKSGDKLINYYSVRFLKWW